MRVSLVTVLWSETGAARECKAIADVRNALPSDGELIIIDNSPKPHVDLERSLIDKQQIYVWNQGYNELYGGGINRAVQLARGDAIVYFSCKRGMLNNPAFVDDLIAALTHKKIGIAGNVRPCSFACIARVEADIFNPQVHVQGGLWGAKREVLLKYPYDSRFWQVYSDVWLSWKLVKEGYRLANVGTVAALPIGKVPDPEKYKYVVDYRD